MRRPVWFRLAMALLTRVDGGGPYGEAMRGDLLEELQRTGDAGRFLREVLRAVLRGGWRRCGETVRPLVFSAGWGVLYPVWQMGLGGRMWPGLAQRGSLMEWPYSSVALLASAGMSPLLFAWGGVLLYLGRNQRAERWEVRWFHLVRGLSLSLSVLLVSGMALASRHADGPGMWLGGGERTAVPGFHVTGMSVCLTLSVLAATIAVKTSRPRLRAR